MENELIDTLEVRIVLGKNATMPTYATSGSAGADLYAANEQSILLKIGERALIPTDLRMEIPEGYEVQIRPRSGLALKYGIILPNSPGTIDADYRGEVGIIIMNLGYANFQVNKGDRIAQMVVNKIERPQLVIASFLSETARGEGGFGSTGYKA